MLKVVFIAFSYLLCIDAYSAGMGYDDARLLLSRSGFSPTQTEVLSYAALSRVQAVDKLLASAQTTAATSPPDWVTEPIERVRPKDLSEEEKKAYREQQVQRGLALRAWWYREMLDTRSPLTEHMTLFWHNHFVSSQQKVKSPQLLYRQNVLLRQYALGNFGTLLHAVAKDPAMLLYLDNATNRRGHPNENFAREVMELFTLGMGNYTEQDVREAARAFTGWSLNRDSGEFRFYPGMHDSGEKTVLGRSGNLDGDAVLDILLAQPQTSEFIVQKLWREFISATPDRAEVKRWAKIFRERNYEIAPVLRAMFISDAFYAPANRAALIKSPVELMVGTLRQFSMSDADTRLLVLAGRQLGQDIFAPPNVKGWPGGEDWINSTTLLARKQVLERIFRGEEMPTQPRLARMEFGRGGGRLMALMTKPADTAMRFDAARFYRDFPGTPAQQRADIARLVLGGAPSQVIGEDAAQPKAAYAYLQALVSDPLYQLK